MESQNREPTPWTAAFQEEINTHVQGLQEKKKQHDTAIRELQEESEQLGARVEEAIRIREKYAEQKRHLDASLAKQKLAVHKEQKDVELKANKFNDGIQHTKKKIQDMRRELKKFTRGVKNCRTKTRQLEMKMDDIKRDGEEKLRIWKEEYRREMLAHETSCGSGVRVCRCFAFLYHIGVANRIRQAGGHRATHFRIR
jgi:chromosome segregation ATPase